MLLTLILKVFYYFLESLIFILPNTSTLPSEIGDSLSFFQHYYSSWNTYLPVDALITVIAFIVVVEYAIFIFGVLNWVYNKIRG